MKLNNIVLMGDSIFDNAGYVAEGDSVIAQLNQTLPENTKATLLAVDGDVTDDVYAQLEKLPSDTTHIFVSCGGNDALRIASILNKPSESVGHAMDVLTDVKNQFEERYSRMIATLRNKVEKVTICTVYDSVPDYSARALTALSMFNDVILKEAFKINAPVIDLRLVCHEAEDYSPISPIEPSKYGAKKITDLIIKVTQTHCFSSEKNSVYI